MRNALGRSDAQHDYKHLIKKYHPHSIPNIRAHLWRNGVSGTLSGDLCYLAGWDNFVRGFKAHFGSFSTTLEDLLSDRKYTA